MILCELLLIDRPYKRRTGAYAAFSAGEVHFKLERTPCQQSLKSASLYNTESASFFTEKRNISFVYVRYVIIILSITQW